MKDAEKAGEGAHPLFELSGVVRQFGSHFVPGVQGASAVVPEGCWLMLLAPSGLGKSTLLNILGLLDLADNGTVVCAGSPYPRRGDGRKQKESGVSEMEQFRSDNFGFVFQHDHLLDHLSASENLALPLLLRGAKLKDALEKVRPLGNFLFDAPSTGDPASSAENSWDGQIEAKSPADLSGGQRNRLALGRGLVHDPAVLLLDEPFTYLDGRLRRRVEEGLKNWQKGGLDAITSVGGAQVDGRTRSIVMATHDLGAAARLGTWFLLMPHDSKTDFFSRGDRENARDLELRLGSLLDSETQEVDRAN